MICKKCGAPVPVGTSVCPYCGAAVDGGAARPRQDEETAFSSSDENEYTVGADEPTEFAGGSWTARPGADSEETEFAGAAPGYNAGYTAGPVQPPAADSAPAPGKGRKAKKPKKEKPRKGKPAGQKSSALRVVLIVILILLIVALVAKPYIDAYINELLKPIGGYFPQSPVMN